MASNEQTAKKCIGQAKEGHGHVLEKSCKAIDFGRNNVAPFGDRYDMVWEAESCVERDVKLDMTWHGMTWHVVTCCVMTSHMTCHVMSRTAKNKLSKSKKSRASPCQAMPGTAKQCLGKAKERSCSCLGKNLAKPKIAQECFANEKPRWRILGLPKTFQSPNCCKPEPLDPRTFPEK